MKERKFKTLKEAQKYLAECTCSYWVWKLPGKVYKYLVATEFQWLNYR